eukprot:3721342-Amphidinium_carterae.1
MRKGDNPHQHANKKSKLPMARQRCTVKPCQMCMCVVPSWNFGFHKILETSPLNIDLSSTMRHKTCEQMASKQRQLNSEQNHLQDSGKNNAAGMFQGTAPAFCKYCIMPIKQLSGKRYLNTNVTFA